jgi:hypothetical protein
MSDTITPQRTNQFDPRPVIKYAAERAVSSGRDRFVFVQGINFAYGTKPPTPQQSHWRVDHKGELFAHLGGQDVTEYNYEPCDTPEETSK